MDSIILSRSRKFGRNIIGDDEFATLANLPADATINNRCPYFFFTSEISVPAVPYPRNQETLAQYAELKKTEIRHCIPNRNSYVDYVAGKEYYTLEEWAADNGKTLGDIVYGINDIHFINFEWNHSRVYYMPLDTLVEYIMPQKKIVLPTVVVDRERMRQLISAIEEATAELKSLV